MLVQVLLSAVLFNQGYSVKLPAIFQKCDAKQATFNSCLGPAVEDALRKLKNPIPELDLPSFDPLLITKGLIPKEDQINFSIEEDLNSFALHNITTAKVLKFNLDFKEKTIRTILAIDDFQFSFTNMTLKGKAYGENFNFTLHGHAKHKNSKFNVKLVFEEVEKENGRFINIVDGKLSWTFDSHEFKSESDNKEAAAHYNQMVVNHLKEVSQIIKQDYNVYFASLFVYYSNNVFSKVSILELFNL